MASNYEWTAGKEAFTAHYFKKVTGYWSGAYRFQIINRSAMRAEVPGRIDRLRFLLLQKLSPVCMETSVSWATEKIVLHTTRISSWRLFCMDSVELFQLHENGTTLTVQMSQRLAPTFWLKRTFPDGHGEVHLTANGAAYHLPWIGGVIAQQTRIVEQGVELIQTSPWFSGNVLLSRYERR